MTATSEAAADHVTEWSGYRRHTRARSTGTLVVLVDAYEQGLESPSSDPDGQLRWGLICNGTPERAHDGCVMFPTQADARSSMPEPEEWCPYCQEETRGSPTTVPSQETLAEACETGTYVDEAQEDRRATEWNEEEGRWQIPAE